MRGKIDLGKCLANHTLARMAQSKPIDVEDAPPSGGAIERIATRARRLFAREKASLAEINQSNEISYGLSGSETVSALMGAGKREPRDRRAIYQKWQDMEADPIVSTAAGLLTTAALGGHETSGQVVFVELNPLYRGNKEMERMVADIGDSLTEAFNNVSFSAAYQGVCFGDAYARLFTKQGKGVTDVHMEETYYPPLVQAWERGGRTEGYSIYTGQRNYERLSVMQLARLKMQRNQFVPQHSVYQKSLRSNVQANTREDAPLMPSLVGGSLLYNAEEPYDNLYSSLVGLTSSRWKDSIDEEIMMLQMDGMTYQQQEDFKKSIAGIMKKSSDRAKSAVEAGRPILTRIRHLLPVFSEKQLSQLNTNAGSSGQPLTIEDVMLHARLLSGSLGVDLSMIGFADQMSGGLGEGGFFRSSAQVGERARVIRTGMTGFYNHIIDVHTAVKFGAVFPASKRPWIINFYGSIAALESERSRTRMDAVNSGGMLAQAIDQLKNMGATEEIAREFLAKTMALDDEQAQLYAKLMTTPRPDAGGGGAF